MKRSRSAPQQRTLLQQQIALAAESLGEGEVVSFGDLAARAGRPNAARAAGAVLANSADTLPWWRVVYSDGHLPPCNPGLQAERLADEGVELRGYRVVRSPKGRFVVGSNSGPASYSTIR
jgi:methylated-DNA-protein-cysteine methyltransferase-like protein